MKIQYWLKKLLIGTAVWGVFILWVRSDMQSGPDAGLELFVFSPLIVPLLVMATVFLVQALISLAIYKGDPPPPRSTKTSKFTVSPVLLVFLVAAVFLLIWLKGFVLSG